MLAAVRYKWMPAQSHNSCSHVRVQGNDNELDFRFYYQESFITKLHGKSFTINF